MVFIPQFICFRWPGAAWWIWWLFPHKGWKQDLAIKIVKRVRYWQQSRLTARTKTRRALEKAMRFICTHQCAQYQAIKAAGFADLSELLAEVARLKAAGVEIKCTVSARGTPVLQESIDQKGGDQ